MDGAQQLCASALRVPVCLLRLFIRGRHQHHVQRMSPMGCRQRNSSDGRRVCLPLQRAEMVQFVAEVVANVLLLMCLSAHTIMQQSCMSIVHMYV